MHYKGYDFTTSLASTDAAKRLGSPQTYRETTTGSLRFQPLLAMQRGFQKLLEIIGQRNFLQSLNFVLPRSFH